MLLELVLIALWGAGFVLALANFDGDIGLNLTPTIYIQLGDIVSLAAAGGLVVLAKGGMRVVGIGLLVLTLMRVLFIGSPLSTSAGPAPAP